VEKSKAARVVLEEMQAQDVLIFTNGGLDRSTAICGVEPVDRKPVFTDGPYVESKEHLDGFAVVDVPDDETARYWAGRLTSRSGVTAPGRSESASVASRDRVIACRSPCIATRQGARMSEG
jgi:hypothetical protein